MSAVKIVPYMEMDEYETWHFWAGKGSPTFKNAPSHVLCWIASGVMPDPEDDSLSVTRNKTAVTCQECLELMHS